MSFILDALKKSETDRQRQSGPALFEMKVAASRPGLPAWALALGGLLAVNLGVVAWLVLRHPSRAQTPAAKPVPIVQSAVPPVPTAAAQPATVLAAAVPAAAAPPVNAVPEQAPAQPNSNSGEELDPQDYEPATEPGAPPASPLTTASSRGRSDTGSSLPDYQQVAGTAAVSGMPDLRLDLHVFAAKPQDRFVFLNMHRLHEGESLPEGVRVERITRDGAILSWRGTPFLLERE